VLQWVEYLRWLQHQSRLFLRPAYTQADIAELLDSDDDIEIVDDDDKMTHGGTMKSKHGTF
jgi:hypothetical protein